MRIDEQRILDYLFDGIHSPGDGRPLEIGQDWIIGQVHGAPRDIAIVAFGLDYPSRPGLPSYVPGLIRGMWKHHWGTVIPRPKTGPCHDKDAIRWFRDDRLLDSHLRTLPF